MPMPGKPHESQDNLRTAAVVLVDQLHIHGISHLFCVPGESYLPVLDALHDSGIKIIDMPP